MIQETSKIAYLGEVRPTLSDRQVCVFGELQKEENLTNSELAGRLNWPINTITPRTNELVKLKLVAEDVKRRCRVTGRTAIAWKVIKTLL